MSAAEAAGAAGLDGLAPAAEAARLSDLLWLGLAVVLVVGTGLGVRMPWPADEPRFVLIARRRVST